MSETIKNIITGLVVILLIGSITYNIVQHQEIKKKDKIQYDLDSLQKYDSVRYSQLALNYRTIEQAKNDLESKNASLYDIISKQNENIDSYVRTILKLKDQVIIKHDTVTHFIVKDSIIQVPIGDDKVSIHEGNDLFDIVGTTYLYPVKGYDLSIKGKPFGIDLVITEDINGIYKSYIDTKTTDLQLLSINTKVIRETPSFWKQLSLLGSLYLGNNTTTLGANVMYKKIGVGSLMTYDYNQKEIKYSFGLTYKIF